MCATFARAAPALALTSSAEKPDAAVGIDLSVRRHRPDGELGTAGGAHLGGGDDIERQGQHTGHLGGHDHPAARNPEHHGVEPRP